ncbi:MAG TPA: DUF4157 domain-containing protein [Pyrinomonadaceae bacterium]
MRLSDESRETVQRFFREHRGEPGLRLPPVRVHAGAAARLLTGLAGASGITFGRRVFVRPSLVGRDGRGRAVVPAALLVHEAAHVLQYEERGAARFLFDYLRGYWRALRAGRRWGAAGRVLAYLAIEEEREAYAAEQAFTSRAPRT